jgi:UPF0755 protein
MKVERLLLGLALLTVAVFVLFMGAPYRGFVDDTFVEIPPGTRTREVARLLAKAGVVRSQLDFLAVRALRPRAKLQAGEYLFRESASTWDVFRRLERGDVYFYEVTVPEGSNSFDISAAVERLGLMRRGDFLEATRDTSSIRDLAPEAQSLEGYLFPDTYHLSRHTTAAQLCLQMTGRFRKTWQKLNPSQPAHTAVTLASLIEKETGRADERPLVASVFHNRLKRGMALDCDPTAIYAALLENRYYGTLGHGELLSQNPYNTYQHAGLPPGPIANPGLASLQAALHPAETNYLFFVAKGDGSGTHTFSADIDAHSAAVGRYRRANVKRNQAGARKTLPRKQVSGAGN